MKSWILIGLSMASGVVASVVVSRTMVREAAVVATPRSAQIAAATSAGSDSARPRPRLEQRIDALRAAEQAEGGEGDEAPAPDAGMAAQRQEEYPTEEEARARTREVHQAMRAAMQAQAADPVWAPSAQTKFTADLEQMGAKVDTVDCRTNACVATLEWPSRSQAQQEYRHVIEAAYQLPCDRQIFLDQSGDEEGPYRAELLIDCESVRAREN